MFEIPKISVVIPMYNQKRYLRYCLESVLLQNLQEIEIICVNDGSTDGSFEIISELAWTDERIRIIDQEHKGVDAARYVGVKEAHGEYMAFIDPEDRYYNLKTLELLYDKAKNNNALICGGCAEKYNNEHYDQDISDECDEKYDFIDDSFYSYSEYQFDRNFQRFIFDRNLLLDIYSSSSSDIIIQEPVWFVKALDKAGCFYGIAEKVYSYRDKVRKCTLDKTGLSYIISGITEVSRVAVKKGYDRLLELAKMRLIREYAECIYSYICDKDEEIIKNLSDYEAASGFKNIELEILSFIISLRDSKIAYQNEELNEFKRTIEDYNIEKNALTIRLDSDHSVLEILNENMSAVLKELSIRNKTNKKRHDDNIIPYPYVDTSHEKDGILWTDLGDGRIEATGTAEQDTKFRLTPILAKTNIKTNNRRYIVTVGAENVSSFTWYIAGGVGSRNNGEFSRESLRNLTINDTDHFAKSFEIDTSGFDYFSGISIIVKEGRALDHIIFDPTIVPID